MRLAIPYWQGRVSPVFDEARWLLRVDVIQRRIAARTRQRLLSSDPWGRAREIAQYDVECLVCGAISRIFEVALCSAGISVFSQLCGSMDEVLHAFVEGRLKDPACHVPGWHQEGIGQNCWAPAANSRQILTAMDTTSERRSKMPRGDGTGPAGGGRRSGGGRMGGPMAAGPGGVCVCTSCGAEVPHVAGQPCNTRSCPKCGAQLSRK
jgi:predicted Fe-Mo cluster-binding NifX family protein